MIVTFIDRTGTERQVEITAEERLSGYKNVMQGGAENLRGPLLKLWLDGHLGVRHCCTTKHYSCGVVKGGSHRVWQGDGVGARVVHHVGPAVVNSVAKCHIATGEVELAAEIIRAFAPHA